MENNILLKTLLCKFYESFYASLKYIGITIPRVEASESC